MIENAGNPGFPGFDRLATQSLGYVAAMLEAAVPVVYFYIADAHDKARSTHVDRLLLTQRRNTTPFSLHFDDAANLNINGKRSLRRRSPNASNCDGINVPCTYAKKESGAD